MIAQGGNDRGIVGVIPQGPERSNVCLRVAKVVPDGEGAALISSLLEGMLYIVNQGIEEESILQSSSLGIIRPNTNPLIHTTHHLSFPLRCIHLYSFRMVC